MPVSAPQPIPRDALARGFQPFQYLSSPTIIPMYRRTDLGKFADNSSLPVYAQTLAVLAHMYPAATWYYYLFMYPAFLTLARLSTIYCTTLCNGLISLQNFVQPERI
jgi:hypothetical protein